jgi:P27 family predicted phage terminase small subunit
MRGRKPEPTTVKLLRGARMDRVNELEPPPPPGQPEPPEHLDNIAKAEWTRIAGILSRMGLLSHAEGPALMLYCEAYSKWLRARGEIVKRGMVIERDILNSNGHKTGTRLFANPAILIEMQAMRLMKDLLVEFGLTPSSRARVKVDQPPVDALADFLGRRGRS